MNHATVLVSVPDELVMVKLVPAVLADTLRTPVVLLSWAVRKIRLVDVRYARLAEMPQCVRSVTSRAIPPAQSEICPSGR